jgi:hypothetical protein
VITPSTLNVLVIGASMIIFAALWRWIAASLSERPVGQAMAAIL